MSRRLQSICLALAAVVFFCGVVVNGKVEEAALKQPDHREYDFSEPLKLKGVTRFVTKQQKEEFDAATAAEIFGGLVFLVGAAIPSLLRSRLKL
jgi:hypothetical protein